MFEFLTAHANTATVLGSIPASSYTVESEGRQREALLKSRVPYPYKFSFETDIDKE
jgi:hypothetical protein